MPSLSLQLRTLVTRSATEFMTSSFIYSSRNQVTDYSCQYRGKKNRRHPLHVGFLAADVTIEDSYRSTKKAVTFPDERAVSFLSRNYSAATFIRTEFETRHLKFLRHSQSLEFQPKRVHSDRLPLAIAVETADSLRIEMLKDVQAINSN